MAGKSIEEWQQIESGALGTPNGIDASFDSVPDVSLYVPATSVDERKWILATYAALEPYIAEGRPPSPRQSTLKKYYYRFQRHGIKGLVRKNYKKGNGRNKADKRSIALARQVIKDEHLTSIKSEVKAGYAIYTTMCKEKYLFPISITWFKELVKSVPIAERTEAREGKRRAYSLERGTGPRYLDPDRSGGWFMSRFHIDASPVPVQLRCRYTGIQLGNPNLVVMVDSFSQWILAYLLTLLPVTRGVIMALIRLCAMVEGRLTLEGVIDKGPELQAIDVAILNAQARCTIVNRRTRKAKDGRPAEGFFGSLERRLWNNVDGNTQNSELRRCLTPEVDPKVRAVHDIESLDGILRKFIDGEYHVHPMGTLAVSPRDLREFSLSQHGTRNFRPIANDRNLLIATSPTARPPYSKIHHRRGLICTPFEYWSDRFTDVRLIDEKAERRLDYLHCGHMFGGINNEWIDAYASPHPLIDAMSAREAHYLSEEYERRYHKSLELGPSNMDSLGRFLTALREEESSLRMLLRLRGDKAHLDDVLDNSWSPEETTQKTRSPVEIPQATRLYGIENV
jgi:putative transposase